MADSSKDELERLQKLRTELATRLVAIEDEQKTVEENVKILREKRDSFASLRIEKKELEDKLKEPNRLSMSEAILKTKEEIENKKDTLEPEKEEPSKTIEKKDEQILESDETPEEPVKKKKLGIF